MPPSALVGSLRVHTGSLRLFCLLESPDHTQSTFDGENVDFTSESVLALQFVLNHARSPQCLQCVPPSHVGHREFPEVVCENQLYRIAKDLHTAVFTCNHAASTPIASPRYFIPL